jgi:hypothetical protein
VAAQELYNRALEVHRAARGERTVGYSALRAGVACGRAAGLVATAFISISAPGSVNVGQTITVSVSDQFHNPCSESV